MITFAELEQVKDAGYRMGTLSGFYRDPTGELWYSTFEGNCILTSFHESTELGYNLAPGTYVTRALIHVTKAQRKKSYGSSGQVMHNYLSQLRADAKEHLLVFFDQKGKAVWECTVSGRPHTR
jgi:hypothetical protein